MLNWKNLKIAIALVLIAAISYWAFNTLRPNNYSGTSLNFSVGHGTVTLNNPSPEPVTVQILGTGTRTFRVVSDTVTLSGTSTRVGAGSTATQVFDMTIPQGISEFSVTGGTNISAVVNSPTVVEVTAWNLSEGEARAVMIFAALVIAGAIIYILRATQDMWMPLIRPVNPDDVPLVKAVESAQGEATQSYGDNRKAR
jgi:hypothetical protein